MDIKSKTYQFIKGDNLSKIQDLNKIIMSKEISNEEINEYKLKEKLNKIQEKLNKTEIPGKGIPDMERTSLFKKHTSNELYLKFFDTAYEEDFRHFNIFLPKIRLSQNTQVRSTFSQQMTNFEEKIKFTSPSINATENSIRNSELKFKKLNKLNNFKKEYSFYENKYFEFTYNDAPDRVFGWKKLTDNKVFLSFKKMIDDKALQEYQLSDRSVILKYYHSLLILEENNKMTEIEESRVREDELIYDPKEHEEEKKKEVSHNGKGKNAKYKEVNNNTGTMTPDNKFNEAANKYKNWFLMESKKLIKNKKNSTFTNINENEKNTVRQRNSTIHKRVEKNQEEVEQNTAKDTSIISFGIQLQILIDKAIRQSNKYHLRILYIEGPIVTWYRYKENQTEYIKKDSFDLRRSNIAKQNQQNNQNQNYLKQDIKKEECTVTFKIKNKNKEDEDKVIKFSNEPIKTFNKKTIKDIFDQIKRFYNLIIYFFKQNKIDFQKLRFISDPKITFLYLSREDCNTDLLKSIIDNIDWHLHLTRVHLKGVDKASIIKFFGVMKNSDILLEDIKIESIMNYNTLEFEGTSNMLGPIKEYFTKSCCRNLVEFHLIDVKIPDLTLILNILRSKFKKNKKEELSLENKHSPVDFSVGHNNNMFNQINQQIAQNLVENAQNASNNLSSTLVQLPYKRLSFKKVSNTNAIINIDLNELYRFFMDMVAEAGGENKFENVFECLDIAGADCTNIEGMKNIINDFKIIKHLNLSGTKITVKNTHNQREKGYGHSNDKSSNIHLNDFLINNLKFVNSKDIKEQENYNSSTLSLLTTLTLYETPLSTDASVELLQWFKRFRFLKEIYFSEFSSTLSSSANSEIVKFSSLVTDVKNEDNQYCENFFEIEYSDKMIV